MSRIGKKAVPIPDKVQVALAGGHVVVKGPKGELERTLPEGVKVAVEGKQIHVERLQEDTKGRALHGLVRSLLSNMVTGVSKGFERQLEINGVGYRAEVMGQILSLSLGYSHPIAFLLPQGVSAQVEKGRIALFGIDREVLGQTAAKLRSFRPPEPYKGKGIKYAEEKIRRKVGKTGATAAG